MSAAARLLLASSSACSTHRFKQGFVDDFDLGSMIGECDGLLVD